MRRRRRREKQKEILQNACTIIGAMGVLSVIGTVGGIEGGLCLSQGILQIGMSSAVTLAAYGIYKLTEK